MLHVDLRYPKLSMKMVLRFVCQHTIKRKRTMYLQSDENCRIMV